MQGDINTLLSAREKQYGEFHGHAKIAQWLKSVMRKNRSWPALDDDQKEALDMIQHKIARILNGNPDYADSWVDIAGYATLVANRISKNTPK